MGPWAAVDGLWAILRDLSGPGCVTACCFAEAEVNYLDGMIL